MKNKIESARLHEARKELFYGYGSTIMAFSSLVLAFLLFCLVDLKQGGQFTANLLQAAQGIFPWIVFVLALGSAFLFYQKDKLLTWYKAKRKYAAFCKNLGFVIRDEYGYVTDENLGSIQRLANMMYGMSVGSSANYKFSYASPEVLNQLCLSKAEYLAVYGRVYGFGNRVYAI